MKIFVTGANGQLGAELCRQLGSEAVGLSRQQMDVGDREAVLRFVRAEQPDAIINAAAYTKVDLAEREVQACRAINAGGVANLVAACQDVGCSLVQISTDYVFGAKDAPRVPHLETDATHAQGVYARTKLEGEQEAQQFKRHTIVRTCGLYGHPDPNVPPNNFVDTMLRLGRERDELKVVGDQHCTPSYVRHVARAICFLTQEQHFGLFHVTNQGETTWYDLAAEIFRHARLGVHLHWITTAEYGAPAPRPSYSVLDTSKYHELGGPTMPHWTEALREYLKLRGV